MQNQIPALMSLQFSAPVTQLPVPTATRPFTIAPYHKQKEGIKSARSVEMIFKPPLNGNVIMLQKVIAAQYTSPRNWPMTPNQDTEPGHKPLTPVQDTSP
jgi:hypothetical protein